MHDVDLKSSLTAVEGDAPSPEFLASMYARIEDECADDGDDDLPAYFVELDDAAPARLTVEKPPGARHRRAGAALVAAAAVVAIVVGLVVVDSGGGGDQVATTRLPHGSSTSDLAAAIVQSGDGDVVIATDPSAGLDPIVPPWYGEEHSTIDDLGFVDGLSVPFDLEVPGQDYECRDLRRTITIAVGVRHLACGGSSGALLFADDTAAVRALDVLVSHLESHSAGVYGLGVPLERVSEFEAQLGDEAEAFVLEEFVDSRVAARVVVIVWRADNLVQFVWDIQDPDTPGGADALMDVADRIERRTAVEGQADGG
jgi:hypothetical protein